MDFTPIQKKIIGNYIKTLLELEHLSQAAIGRSYRCSTTAVHIAIWQVDPLHVKLVRLKDYISQQVGHDNWTELCLEALEEEEIGA